MEIRTLRYFLAVAQEENMTRAARKLHVTQPTLSKQIQALEEELGAKLFLRGRLSMKLTETGRLLRDRAEALVTMADKIQQEFRGIRDAAGGELYLGLAESQRIRLLAQVIRRLKERYPNLHYHLTSGGTRPLLEKLDSGLLDFAVLTEPPDFSRYHAIPFPQAEIWGVVMHREDPLARQDAIQVEDLVGKPLYCADQCWEKEIAAWAGSRFSQLTLEGTYTLSFNSSMFAQEGLGYLLVFDGLIDTSPESGMVFVPLTPRTETRLHLVWKKNSVMTPMAKIFREEIRAAFQGGDPADKNA